jgi:hypothetical protein
MTKKRRAQLKHGLFDTDYPEKDKIAQLEEKYGGDGCWYYTCLQLAMSKATDAQISPAKALRIGDARRFDRKRTEEILGFLLDRDMLVREGEMLSAPRVIEDQEALAVSQDKWKEAKRRQRGQEGGQREDKDRTDGLPSEESEESEEIKETVSPNFAAWDFPPTLDTPGIRKALELFAAKMQQRHRPLDEIWFSAMACQYASRPKEFEENLIYSAGLTKVSNLIEKPRGNDPNGSRPSRYPVQEPPKPPSKPPKAPGSQI